MDSVKEWLSPVRWRPADRPRGSFGPWAAVTAAVLLAGLLVVGRAVFPAFRSTHPAAAADSAIAQFLDSYFRDWSAGDMAAYRAHFDESAHVSFVRDGRVEWCQELDPFIREQDRILRAAAGTMRERMTSFTAENDAVTAHVTARWELAHGGGKTVGVDRFTLVRDPAGRWKIIALVFYHTGG